MNDRARDHGPAPTPEQIAYQIAFEARRLGDADELTEALRAEMRARLEQVLESVAPEHAGPTLMLFLGARVSVPQTDSSSPAGRRDPAPPPVSASGR